VKSFRSMAMEDRFKDLKKTRSEVRLRILERGKGRKETERREGPFVRVIGAGGGPSKPDLEGRASRTTPLLKRREDLLPSR